MIARLFCWLGFHDWLCVYRDVYVPDPAGMSRKAPREEYTTWKCSRCSDVRHEERG